MITPTETPTPAPTEATAAPPEEEKKPAIEFVFTTNLPAVFSQLQISLAVTTYQAQRVMTISSTGEKLTSTMRVLQRPTGMAIKDRKMVVCAKNQVWFFAPVYDLRNLEGEALPYDVTFVPRHTHITGDIAGHEMAFVGNDLVIVNTRFSCLCTLTAEWSFVPGWKPKFVTAYAAEDRCHLNGLTTDEKGPKFVTALGETNNKDAWRENKVSGGIIIDVPSGEVVSRGLCMPHSPRLHGGRLFVLESGRGELQVVDVANGSRTTVARFPGYLRGLSFYGQYAFVGTCKIRETNMFGGMPISEQVENLRCSIFILDLQSGKEVGFIEFTRGVEELFDIQVLAGINNPHIIGMEEDTIDGVFVLPPGFVK